MVWFWFGLVLSTIVGHLMPNPFHTVIKYMISKHLLKITFLNKPGRVFRYTVKCFLVISNNSVKHKYSLLFAHSYLLVLKRSFLVHIQLNVKNSSVSNNSVLHVNKVKWFQVLLCITNNLTEHQTFVYTQLNDRTVVFQTIQFSLSTVFLFTHN